MNARKLNDGEVRNLLLFNEVSNLNGKDCTEFENEIVFLVTGGEVDGIRRQVLERIFKKKVIVVNEEKDIKAFVENFYNKRVEASFDGNKVIISGNKKIIFGKDKKSLNILKALLRKYFGINKIVIK